MKPLKQALTEYLRIRRSLGFRLRNEEVLRNFVAFLHAEGASYITRELALRWATQPATAQPATWASHLRMVRRFAIWHSAIDPRNEIPPVGLLPHRFRRKSPHIYSDEEIEKLLRQTQQLPSPKRLRALTYTTLFGLLIATGMRVNEALGLNRSDVDLQLGILHIRWAKFGKSRYIPVHASTVEALKKYAETRDRLFPAPPSPRFFISERGRRITGCMARYTFAKVSQQLGLRAPVKGSGRGPRLQDMRHRFATRTLIHWYRSGLDVERELPKLSTYLGHVHVNDTYWYVQAVPELLQLATDRLSPREVQL
ncbi:MAG TPA: tyrosine-type recombinase/integrase [Candidatus Dormibacteraeota bacterium]|nr:tyrosine-type recombinase/integrase [Candidatus Dormibacteraeota bacterium]